jgi:hypothetical protein
MPISALRMPAAFHLEHADRLAARQHGVGLLIVERHVVRSMSMPRRRTSVTAFSSTDSVFRPRKSNLTSPACSTHFMLNWVTGMSERGSRYIGTSSHSGRSPITMPAAWVEAWR